MSVRMTEEEAWGFLEAGHTATFTTLRRDGWPVSLPVWYVVIDGAIYLGTPSKSRKVGRIKNDDRGCVLVEQGEAWIELAAVEVPVRISEVEPTSDESGMVLAALDAKYADFRPGTTRMPDATKKHYSGQTILRLDPAGPFLTWDNTRIRMRS